MAGVQRWFGRFGDERYSCSARVGRFVPSLISTACSGHNDDDNDDDGGDVLSNSSCSNSNRRHILFQNLISIVLGKRV